MKTDEENYYLKHTFDDFTSQAMKDYADQKAILFGEHLRENYVLLQNYGLIKTWIDSKNETFSTKQIWDEFNKS